MGNWKNVFPDYEQLERGAWSSHGLLIDTGDDKLEIDLYREPDDGTYTIQIFRNDDVVYCHSCKE